jgi:hypothetical protein
MEILGYAQFKEEDYNIISLVVMVTVWLLANLQKLQSTLLQP